MEKNFADNNITMILKILHAIGLTNLSDADVTKYYTALAGDMERDIKLFREYGLNLMDPRQLAEAQIAKDGPFQISVFAPDPLEAYVEDVYKSTLAWVKQHIDDLHLEQQNTEAQALLEGPRMVFWCRQSESNPKMLGIVGRVHKDMNGDNRVFRLFDCVKAPDHLFFVDMTMHRYRNRHIKVYINPRVNGVTKVLLQLPDGHAVDVVNMFSQWLSSGKESYLAIEEVGSGLVPGTKRTDRQGFMSVRCWTIGDSVLTSEDTRRQVAQMFPKGTEPLLKAVQ